MMGIYVDFAIGMDYAVLGNINKEHIDNEPAKSPPYVSSSYAASTPSSLTAS
jgi:hypothetical protein